MDPDPSPGELRRARILETVRRGDFVRVADLGEMFGVSSVTVRADLDVLAARGELRRIRGGAMPQDAAGVPEGDDGDLLAVGRAAARLVRDGECVLLDAGAGALALARALVEARELRGAVVVTSGLEAARLLEPSIPRLTVVVTGGTLQGRSLVDPLGALVFGRLRAHAVFLSCDGIDARAGVTDTDLREAAIKRHMVDAAERRVALAVGAAVGGVHMAQVCKLEDVDVLVCERGADAGAVRELEESGLEVLVA